MRDANRYNILVDHVQSLSRCGRASSGGSGYRRNRNRTGQYLSTSRNVERTTDSRRVAKCVLKRGPLGSKKRNRLDACNISYRRSGIPPQDILISGAKTRCRTSVLDMMMNSRFRFYIGTWRRKSAVDSGTKHLRSSPPWRLTMRAAIELMGKPLGVRNRARCPCVTSPPASRSLRCNASWPPRPKARRRRTLPARA